MLPPDARDTPLSGGVDVARRTVEVYSEPDAEAGRYRASRPLGAGETLTTPVLPGLALPVAELFA